MDEVPRRAKNSPIDEIKTAIRKATIANTMVPVLCGTSYQ